MSENFNVTYFIDEENILDSITEENDLFNEDFDGDGVSTLNEVRHHTDPKDPTDF